MSSLREQLLAIREESGHLTPETVLTAATPEDHPLHARFEWDDAAAGHEYRVIQAAELIRSVRVRYTPSGDGAMKSIRAFHVVRDPSGVSAYEPIDEVVHDPLMRAMLVRDMERDWRALRQRWEDFQEFWSLVREDVANTA